MLNFKEFYCRTANRRTEKRGKVPGLLGGKGEAGGQESPLFVSKQLNTAGKVAWKTKTAFPNILIHFSTEHAPMEEQKATADGRWSPPIPQLFGFFPLKGKLFLHNEFLRIFHLYELAAGKSGLGVSQPRKSIRCGCCSGNETFHDQSGKRQKGKSTIFQCFFPARFGEFATMQMEGK